MMNQDSKRPVTLEDILRLKRAERPPVEFWNQFDRELRAKQLAALVEQRPWWRTISLPRILAGVRRYHLPLGATAVLAVTVLSVREYRAPASTRVAAQQPVPAAIAGVSGGKAAAVAVNAVAVSEKNEASVSAVAVETSTLPAAHFTLSSEATPTGGLVHMIPLVGTGPESLAGNLPGAHLVAENFASLSSDESALSRNLLNPARGFESRVMPARSRPVEPLAQMKVPSGSRRSNLIASATLAATTVPVLTSDRSARGLSDERLYDTVSRVNARGAGVLVKF